MVYGRDYELELGLSLIMGRKFPIIRDGLANKCQFLTIQHRRSATYMLCASLRIVKEKQHRISGSFESGFGFFSEQLVRIAFCELSNAMAPNFSQ